MLFTNKCVNKGNRLSKYAMLRYYLMNHPENFVQGYTVMTTQYRYTEYVGLSE